MTGQRVSPSWLADLRAAEEAATARIWRADLDNAAYWCVFGPDGVVVGATERDGIDFAEADARLIAAARNALPQLLAAAEAIAEIRSMHQPEPCDCNNCDGEAMCCPQCIGHWPCDTAERLRALEGATDAD